MVKNKKTKKKIHTKSINMLLHDIMDKYISHIQENNCKFNYRKDILDQIKNKYNKQTTSKSVTKKRKQINKKLSSK